MGYAPLIADIGNGFAAGSLLSLTSGNSLFFSAFYYGRTYVFVKKGSSSSLGAVILST